METNGGSLVSGGSEASPVAEIATDQVFANKHMNVRLDDTNFLLWKQQVTLMTRGHELEHFLEKSTSVPSKTAIDSEGKTIVNPKYSKFRKLDTSLASWLLSTISPNILSHWWELIHQLKYGKRSLKKDSLSIREYTTQIKEICDLLATSGSPVSEVERIAMVLNGLPVEYESSVAAITVSRTPHTFDVVVSMMMDAESRLSDPMRLLVGMNITRYDQEGSQNYSGSRYR
ncbi:hypothetical protein GQ457_02G036070 [Hibiscus cannabinus]